MKRALSVAALLSTAKVFLSPPLPPGEGRGEGTHETLLSLSGVVHRPVR